MTQKVRVQCPNCKVTLEVKNPEGVVEKRIACPKCRTGLLVKFNRDTETTHYDGSFSRASNAQSSPSQQAATQPQAEEGGTRFMGGMTIGRMGKLLLGSKEYPLEIGINTIGRRAATSAASVQIDTDNRSMSRMHAVIEVAQLYNGSVHTVIRNAENKNPTFVGGQLLVDDDRIILNNGDVIKMGNVMLTFITG